jgi:hypothetical protein
MASRSVVLAIALVGICTAAACNRTPLEPSPPVPPVADSGNSQPAEGTPSPDRPSAPVPPPPGPDRPTVPVPPPPEPDRSSCDDRQAAFAIGETASSDLLERARTAAGAKLARFLRWDQPITLEFQAGRLNLGLDSQNIVRKVTCG